MIRPLAQEEIERVLGAEVVGRIGCHAEGRTYVVPVSYVYHNGAIYAHSTDGLKVAMMRQNPFVCFEVDHIEDLLNWHSVIAWGVYEELTGLDAEAGLSILSNGLKAKMPNLPVHEATVGAEAPAHVVAFCIHLRETSGREERLYWNLLPAERGEPLAV